MTRRGRLLAAFIAALAITAGTTSLHGAELRDVGGRPENPRDAGDGDGFFSRHDTLPATMEEMSEYDRIAMEPYADRYDKLPLHEKAELYAAQFEFMIGRAPIFSPAVHTAIRRSAAAAVQANQAARRDIYKKPEDRKARRHGMDLSKLSGPWDVNRKREEPGGAYMVTPDDTIDQESDTRMESLRGGWDSRELLRGGR